MTFLRPTFRVKTEIFDTGLDSVAFSTVSGDLGETRPAINMYYPDLWITGKVEYSLASPMGVGTAQFEIANVRDEHLTLIRPGGLMECRGGYFGTFHPSPGQSMRIWDIPFFAGNIVSATPYQQGADTTWRINATTRPLHAVNKCVSITDPHKYVVGDLIKYIMRLAVGANSVGYMAPSALGDDPDIEGWSPEKAKIPTHFNYQVTDPALNEVERLLRWLNLMTAQPHHLIPNPSKAHHFSLINTLDTESTRHLFTAAGDESVGYTLDMKRNIVYSHGPEPQLVEKDQIECLLPGYPEPLDADPVVNRENRLYWNYKVSIPFDPRISPGMPIVIRNSLLGDGENILMIALDLQHEFDGESAITNVGGPVIDGSYAPTQASEEAHA